MAKTKPIGKHTLRIGKYKLSNQLSLAPMADITDIAYRVLCRKFDCGFTVTEMVNAHAVVHSNEESIKMTRTNVIESPSCIQFFGADKDVLVECAKILEKKCDILNFNMGCPVSKVVDINAGSAMLKDLKNTKEILSAIKNEIKIPFTVKTRLGYDNDVNIIEVANMCDDAGIDCLMIHGRTQAQGYFGNADWKSIELAKKCFCGPIIGNGDVTDEESAKKMLEFCDGAMIGRAAIGNPFIFRRANHYLETGNIMPHESIPERIQAYFDYVKLADKYEISDDNRLKQQAMWFTKGLLGSRELRQKLTDAKTRDDVLKIMQDFLSENI